MQHDAIMQEIVDTHLIRKVLNNYSRGVDRVDIDLVNAIYHEGAMDFHGIFDGPAAQFAQIAMKSQRQEICTSHLIGQSDIEFDGDIAYVETYFFANHLRNLKERGDEPHVIFMSGRYVDRFERKSEDWKIAERRVLQDWVHVAKLDLAGVDLETFHRPKQTKEDASYIGRK